MEELINEDKRYLVDCRVTSLKNLLKDNGINITAIDIFGLGSGLDFSIFNGKMGKTPYISIIGRDLNLEKSLCKQLGIELKKHQSESKLDELDPKIKAKLKKGKKVMLNIDRYYLDYLTIKKTHFGLHSILLVDFDDEEKVVYVEDALADGINKIGYKLLNAAIHSDIDIFPPKGIWYELEVEDNIKPCRTDHVQAIHDCSSKMIYSKSSGISSVIKMLSILKKVKIDFSDEIKVAYLKFQINHLCQVIIGQESTQSLYRIVYGKYLVNTGANYGYKEFVKFGEDFIELGNKLNKLAKKFISQKDIAIKLEGFAHGIVDIFQEEKKLYYEMLSYTNHIL